MKGLKIIRAPITTAAAAAVLMLVRHEVLGTLRIRDATFLETTVIAIGC